MTPQIFIDMPTDPPAPAAAIDAVYAAFAGRRRPAGPFCRECFSEAEEARILRPVALRSADPDDLAGIFFEALDRSVGAEGFMHFLPRALETLSLDARLLPRFPAHMVDAGSLRLGAQERRVLADAFGRATVDFVETGRVAPLGPPPGPLTWMDGVANVGLSLVRGLIAVRVEPRQVFARLACTGDWRGWLTLVALAEDWRFCAGRHPPVSQETDVAALLDRLAAIHFCEVVPQDAFMAGLDAVAGLLPPLQRERLPDRYRALAARAQADARALGRDGLECALAA